MNPTMNLNHYPYPSSRRVIMGKRGAVATSQPQAALAGMEMILKGGNAADAAIAMAIALTVLEPTSNGIGSDAFALIWDGQLHGLNASGYSPKNQPGSLLAGMGEMPTRGWLPVTTPGAPAAWRMVHEKFGKLSFEALFEPAIRYAEGGYAVSPETARAWNRAAQVFGPLQETWAQPFRDTFMPTGRAPKTGEVWSSEGHAATLREIAQTYSESFYRGRLATRIAEFAAATGGCIGKEDLAVRVGDWLKPISVNYRGLTVHEIPPNGQGIAALMALKMLEGFDLTKHPRDSAESFHLQIEAIKLAFADVQRYVADPGYMPVSSADLLNPEYLSKRAALIGDAALDAQVGSPRGGTVYLCAADGELMVSFIQSNYMGFGSGVVVPGTGIALQNRGACFDLTPNHPNRYAPGKRPFHTIIPGFLTRDGKPVGPFGVMGGHMQPQGHVQVVVNLEDYGMNPQTALDAPRWQWIRGREVQLESSLPASLAQRLADRGHQIQMMAEGGGFGRGQIILRESETLIAASEPRADGQALAW
jgi:gamma-glutamyltranspeptidase/glutathione hydrolase